MKFYIESAGGSSPPCEGAIPAEKEGEFLIELNSLDDLLNLSDRLSYDLIIGYWHNEFPRIVIYDTWIE